MSDRSDGRGVVIAIFCVIGLWAVVAAGLVLYFG